MQRKLQRCERFALECNPFQVLACKQGKEGLYPYRRKAVCLSGVYSRGGKSLRPVVKELIHAVILPSLVTWWQVTLACRDRFHSVPPPSPTLTPNHPACCCVRVNSVILSSLVTWLQVPLACRKRVNSVPSPKPPITPPPSSLLSRKSYLSSLVT